MQVLSKPAVFQYTDSHM